MPRLAKSATIDPALDPQRKKTKSRNGCQRCKLKRLKCDETKPECKNCQSRSVSCPGYEKSLKWSTKYELLQPTADDPFRPARKRVGHAPPALAELPLPPDVVHGFEALAAVLPSREKPDSMIASPNVDTSQEGSSEHQEEDVPEVTEASVEADADAARIVDVSQSLDSTLEDIDFEELDAMLRTPCLTAEDVPLAAPEAFGTDILETIEPDPFNVEMEDHTIVPANDRLSRSLLLNYYGLPNPASQSFSEDPSSMLIRHYFSEVCSAYSAFDSHLNPYRSTIGRVFQSSASIYYTIQAMAAAQLANTFPSMSATGSAMQTKAFECLQHELELVSLGQMKSERTMLTILLLGLTGCWHDSSDLALPILTTARNLILPKLLEGGGCEDAEAQRETQFFEESLIYWEMLVGWVSHEAVTFSPSSGMRARFGPPKIGTASRRPDGKIVPHPWTGIAPNLHMLFAEVGRLVRRQRLLRSSWIYDLDEEKENLENAATLEEDLLAAEHPSADELADIGDSKVVKEDFVRLAEAYRYAGLLEIYRVFPSILRKRLGSGDFAFAEELDFDVPSPRLETSHESTDLKLWINSLALHILDTLASLPFTSGLAAVQLILFATASTELKYVSSLDYFDVYANDSKVLQARRFVENQLSEFARRLPAKPIKKVLQMIEEVWRRMDQGEDVFWMDVMIEKGWHTIMG